MNTVLSSKRTYLILFLCALLPNIVLATGHCSCGGGRGGGRSSVGGRAFHGRASHVGRPFFYRGNGQGLNLSFDPHSLFGQTAVGIGLSFIVGLFYDFWRRFRRWFVGLFKLNGCSHPWQAHDWSLQERMICLVLIGVAVCFLLPHLLSFIMAIGSAILFFRVYHNDQSYRSI